MEKKKPHERESALFRLSQTSEFCFQSLNFRAAIYWRNILISPASGSSLALLRRKNIINDVKEDNTYKIISTSL